MLHLKPLILMLLLKTSTNVFTAASYLSDNYPTTVIEDATLDMSQLLQKYGYPAELHYVTTEDHYILCLHRIPKPGGHPVLLMHGLMDSSDTWILMGPWSGLGYFLFDNGYDVWMGNARGNHYSRNHTVFNPDKDKRFWTFSWHEIGIYDLPALIDYVLEQTYATKLGYFGHSQGTTSFWVMCSMRPEYNGKISIMNALAPVAFMTHAKSVLITYLFYIVRFSEYVTEFLPHTNLSLSNCFRSKLTVTICLYNFWNIMGNDDQQLNLTMLPVVYGHIPSGCNLKQWHHYIQLATSDRFCQFDYGERENMKRYGSERPPDYPLEKVSAAVGLYYGDKDYLANLEDVQRLARSLSNVVDNQLYPKWNHMSLIWGVDAKELVYKLMLEMLRKFE